MFSRLRSASASTEVSIRNPRRTHAILCGVCAVAAALVPSIAAAQAGVFQTPPSNLATQTLSANDGWASTAPGTTGGAAALPANIYTVTTFAQLKAALNNKSATAKIIYVSGTVYGDVDANNVHQPCTFFAKNGYTQDAYIASAGPGKAASSALESARAASSSNQAPSVQLQVGSNTTIVGIGTTATLQEINLILGSAVTNVIIRNITFKDAFDCFPTWSPTDQNPQTPPYLAANNYLPGNFNSNYDNISLTGARNVWVDHCTFTDEPDTEDVLPFYFGRPYQVHDGELDIGSGSDLVTVSWNIFSNHGKTSLVGSSDSATATDSGHLRTTFHHNLYTNLEERQPRDRFGALDVYNNYYLINNTSYVYSWGVGNKSMIYADSNAFITAGPQANMTADRIVYPWSGGTAICINGTRFNNPDAVSDVLTLVNAATRLWSPVPTLLTAACGFTPTLRIAPADATQDVPALVLSGAVASPSVTSTPTFDSTMVGNTSSADVTLTNSGAGILLIHSVTATGDYSVGTNGCVTSLAANSSCTVSVHFSPTSDGVRTGTLLFSDWAKNSPQTVSLSGPGVMAGASQLLTTAVLSKTASGYQAIVTVKNNGAGTAQNVQLTSATLGVASGAMPVSLGNIAHGGGSAQITVNFPASAGASGAAIAEKFLGTYTGGSFGGSIRAVLP